jgi:D-3-phosphoglycerate dehydrogenase
VSLHAPLTADTHHIVGTELIGAMERSPVVVNTSRGPLVDPDAAVAALESGRLAGVALDVTEVEPLPADHPLRTHPQAIVTPHMAFYSVEAERELQQRAADEVARALRGEPARCPVNKVG